MWRRRRDSETDRSIRYGLRPAEMEDLARYNAEKSRGLVHTQEWAWEMAALQKRFNEAQRQVLR